MKRILLIMGGGIAAYKCLELIRRAHERGFSVRVVMTRAAREFVTPLSVGALSNEPVLTNLFDLDTEREIGHIRLSREADLIVVAPATADLLARMAGGHADDLATAVLLATDKRVLVAPAMNPRMWLNPATQRNVAQLAGDGILFIGPNSGEMAESGEAGPGRMAEPQEILTAIENNLASSAVADKCVNSIFGGPLFGRHVLITAGPTHEPIDPVRYIANRSSGTQGYAIAKAARCLGADVTLVSGPTNLADPAGVVMVHVQSARDMQAAVKAALPADIAIFTAAVADWRVANASDQKIKKGHETKSGKKSNDTVPMLKLIENPDILKGLAAKKSDIRPRLLIGFAAETENVIEHAKKKLKSKGCDWIVANDVSPDSGVMGGERNAVHIIEGANVDSWPEMDKTEVAERLMAKAAAYLGPAPIQPQKLSSESGRGEAVAQTVSQKFSSEPMQSEKPALSLVRLPHGEKLEPPAYQSATASGLDLAAAIDEGAPLILAPGSRALVPTGFIIGIPDGFEGQVRPRSGLAFRHGVTVLNSPGTIDSDYRGELKALLINHGDEAFRIERGMRIAQLVIAPVLHADIREVAVLDQTERGHGGFGSTGVAAQSAEMKKEKTPRKRTKNTKRGK